MVDGKSYNWRGRSYFQVFDLGEAIDKGSKDKNFLWMMLIVFLPFLILVYGLPFLEGVLPMPDVRRMVPNMNPHLFFFAFLFLPFFVAVILCIILASKTLKDSLRQRY